LPRPQSHSRTRMNKAAKSAAFENPEQNLAETHAQTQRL
jgi:hypothetical protein